MMELMKPMKPMSPMKPMQNSEKWWAGEWGEPASSGSQNDLRYAFFAEAHRLFLEQNGIITSYDTGTHQINGVAQNSGAHGALIFSSTHGEVSLSELKKLQ